MIVRTFENAPRTKLFDDLDARDLIRADDAVSHKLIEVRIKGGTTHSLEPEARAANDVQGYYCISGEGVLKIDHVEQVFRPGILVASGTERNITLKADSDMRVAAIYCNNGIKDAPLVIRDLEEIHGTDRDVFWGNGYSKRLLVKRDGLGFAFCVTFGNSNTDSFLQYRNNLESCYYISGDGEYEWESGKHPILTKDGQGTVFIMNKYDTHNMRISNASICLSIFTPPIEGNESHDFSKGQPSSY